MCYGTTSTGMFAVEDGVGFNDGGNAVVEIPVSISPAGLLSIAAIALAGAVVTGVAIREARRPRLSRGNDRD
jgi:ABC-type enterobactin transport system permease subunit